MVEYAPSRFWIVVKPEEGGDVVARYDTEGESIISQEIIDYGDFAVVSVKDRSSLKDTVLKTDLLTETEKDILGIIE